jgi:predicted aspartyl protease
MVVTVAIQHWADAIAIGIVVVLNTVIGLVQEYRAKNAMQAMIQMSAPKARVRRENHEANIASSGAVHFRLPSQTNYHKNVIEMLFLCLFTLCLCY